MSAAASLDTLAATLNLGPLERSTPVGGGDISAAFRIDCARGTVFAKTGPVSSAAIFSAEEAGLDELANAGCVRVPAVLARGCTDEGAWIALEWLNLEPSTPAADAALGEQLARLHRHTSGQHGFSRDTMIGASVQANAMTSDWVQFYQTQRLDFQLRMAAANGYGGELQSLGQRVIERVPEFFLGYEPEPSLLHGDLWSGNKAACAGQPVIYDPAVYYGDRETDLAMSRLFGGFHSSFYETYQAAWPLADGHERRVELYQLYHLLNHLNLFGGGYLPRAISMMRSLLPGD